MQNFIVMSNNIVMETLEHFYITFYLFHQFFFQLFELIENDGKRSKMLLKIYGMKLEKALLDCDTSSQEPKIVFVIF